MKACPGVIAALPREVSALVKGWKCSELQGRISVYTNGQAVVACAGMGEARAALAVQAAMDAMPVTALLSVGLAGACDPALRVGDVVRAGVVMDGRTRERFECSGAESKQMLVSECVIASVSDKSRLHREFGATAVDMEAAGVARIARARGLEFKAIKAISDEADFEVGALGKFATADGQFREGAFAVHTALRPATWGKMITLGRNSGRAVAALSEALASELDWYSKREAE